MRGLKVMPFTDRSRGSGPTRSSRRSARAAWAKSTGPATRGSTAPSRSRYSPAHLVADADATQRFEREARPSRSLNHPHICALYDIGQQDDIDYLVMEYLEGETLADRLKGPLPSIRRCGTRHQIADALDKAHRHGSSTATSSPAT